MDIGARVRARARVFRSSHTTTSSKRMIRAGSLGYATKTGGFGSSGYSPGYAYEAYVGRSFEAVRVRPCCLALASATSNTPSTARTIARVARDALGLVGSFGCYEYGGSRMAVTATLAVCVRTAGAAGDGHFDVVVVRFPAVSFLAVSVFELVFWRLWLSRPFLWRKHC